MKKLREQRVSKWIGWMVIITSILSLPAQHQMNLSMKWYSFSNCSYAQAVLPRLETYILKHPQTKVDFYTPTANFPSPTMRIQHGDAYLNFVGVEAIVLAFNSLEHNQPFT